MIAFNKLLDNIDEYNHIYKLMGVKENLAPFVVFEDERKAIQLEFEETRATCNKRCSEVAELRKENKDTTLLVKEIKQLNKKANRLQKQLNLWGSIIDSKLKTLPNIPDNYNDINVQIDTQKRAISHGEFSNFLKSFMPTKHSNKSMNAFIKSQKNKLFQESDLPSCTFLKNGVTILCTDTNVNDITKKLVQFFTKNSLSMVCISFKHLNKSSCLEYMIELGDLKFVRIELKREYFTREFKIKYKNKKQDMTKFVNQINIKYL